MKSNLADHQNLEWNGGKTEDEWIIEFVESNAQIFQQYLFWREIQDKIERIDGMDFEDENG